MISRVANISLETPSLGFTRRSQSAHLFRNPEDIRSVRLQTLCVTSRMSDSFFSLLPLFYLYSFHLTFLTLCPFTAPSPSCCFSFLFSHRLLLSRFDGLPLALKRTPTSPGDRAGAEVRSQALVGHRQAPEGSYRQAVPRALAQPPEPGGEEDVVDRGRGPDHLPGARETGKPLG